MKFLLDTSTCIEHLRGRSPSVTVRLEAESGMVGLCSVVVSELLYGAHRSVDPVGERIKVTRFIAGFPSFPFDNTAAEYAATIRSSLATAGTPIGPYDLLIAATAAANRLAVVTCNSAEFARISGLSVEDWRSA